MERDQRAELVLEVDVLDRHMQPVPARGQARDEAVRGQAIAMRAMVGQQHRRVNDEDRQRLGHGAGSRARNV